MLFYFLISCDKDTTRPETENGQSDIAAINEIWDNYTLSVNTDDLDLWMSNWDENGTRRPQDGSAAIGKVQIEAKVIFRFENISSLIPINIEEITVAGNWANFIVSFTLDFTMPDSSIYHYIGKALTIHKKQDDGIWKIYCDCFNFDGLPHRIEKKDEMDLNPYRSQK